MCVEVVVIRGAARTYCETVGELAAALGVRQKKVSADPFDCCLCNAYLDNLGARRATDDEGYPNPAYAIEAATPTAGGPRE
jgi:hypothetical protein